MSEVAADFTGTVYGPVESNSRTGEECRQVFEYERGWCVDAYVTIVRYTDARYGYADA